MTSISGKQNGGQWDVRTVVSHVEARSSKLPAESGFVDPIFAFSIFHGRYAVELCNCSGQT